MIQIPEQVTISREDIQKFLDESCAFTDQYYNTVMNAAEMAKNGQLLSGEDLQMIFNCAVAGLAEAYKAKAVVRGLLSTPLSRLLDIQLYKET